MKHKAVVAEVACAAASYGKTAIFGVLFDEVSRRVHDKMHVSDALIVCFAVRKHWEDESGKKGDRFTVESMIGTGPGTDHDLLLKRATVLYDTLFWKTKGRTEVECKV